MLSEFQIEVLKLKSYGYPTKVIAERLHRQPETIEYHLKEIRIALDAKNTAQMTFIAGAKGLVAANDPEFDPGNESKVSRRAA